MKSFVKYISKYLASFSGLVFILILLNLAAFVGTFYDTVSKDYGDVSPKNMLRETAAAGSLAGISNEMRARLHSRGIWAMFLSPEGGCVWTVDLPPEIPQTYTVQEVAVFSRGYLKDYPVFVWDDGDGLLVLGYPQGSYAKITSNYYSADMLKALPLYFAGIFTLDLLILFAAYYISKVKIVKDTEPLIVSLQALANGKPAELSIKGELGEVAENINQAAHILGRQNQARANWISGVSHDIRTPLSIIMGYADRIAGDAKASEATRQQARIVQKQSVKIKELVQDLNLVSKLEYEMQPLCKENVRLSRLLRGYVAETLNTGIPETHSIDLEIAPAAENAVLCCDARLISRAVGNLVQNSLRHNSQGCSIHICLDRAADGLLLTVADDGTGVSAQTLKELKEKAHYLESTDDRLDLRHGLGLVLVRQIAQAHDGTLRLESEPGRGFKAVLVFDHIGWSDMADAEPAKNPFEREPM